MKLKTIFPLLLTAALTAVYARAQAPVKPVSLFEYLTPGEGAGLTLSTDVSALIANKNSPDYLPATLTDASGKAFSAQVKPRGKYRRRISEIPPLKLKFKKKTLQSEGLDTLNELKIVLPISLDKQGDELIVREYIAYKLFEQLTPVSVRARLINLTLLNTGLGHEARYEVKAILLEDEEETAARLGGQLVELYGMPADSLHIRQAALTVMFQYMIGNTDWSIESQRNVRFLRDQNGQLLLIPFDFDFSGLVSAPYATPNAITKTTHVRERFLMPHGIPETALKQAAETLHAARETLLQVCRTEFLSKPAARDIEDYLNSYFQSVEKNYKGIFR